MTDKSDAVQIHTTNMAISEACLSAQAAKAAADQLGLPSNVIEIAQAQAIGTATALRFTGKGSH